MPKSLALSSKGLGFDEFMKAILNVPKPQKAEKPKPLRVKKKKAGV